MKPCKHEEIKWCANCGVYYCGQAINSAQSHGKEAFDRDKVKVLNELVNGKGKEELDEAAVADCLGINEVDSWMAEVMKTAEAPKTANEVAYYQRMKDSQKAGIRAKAKEICQRFSRPTVSEGDWKELLVNLQILHQDDNHWLRTKDGTLNKIVKAILQRLER